MSEFRCFPQNLVMHEAVPVGQRYTYQGTVPLDEMMKPNFFIAERNRLRPGDVIMLVEMATRKGTMTPIRMAQVMVQGSDRETGVILKAYNGPIDFETIETPVEVSPPSEPEIYSDGQWAYEWGGPKHLWRVHDSRGSIVAKGLTKEEAIKIANGHVPVPNISHG